MKKYFINIILIIVWMFVIFSFSGQSGESSGSLSNEIIIKIAEIFIKEEITPDMEQKLIKTYSFPLRKSAHFGIYFILGVLVFLLAKKVYGIIPKAFIYTVIFCAIYACTDELHQAFISGRSCQLFDVFIDTCGGFTATIILYYIGFIKNKRIILK